MSDENSTIPDGFLIEMDAPRTEKVLPSFYRLMHDKQTGETVLQGYYEWEQGGMHGGEWRDIPTVTK